MLRRTLVLALLILGVALVARTSADGADRYRFAAVFDSARGMVPGQLVKIAGAKVGTIERVDLTRRNEARITFEIDDRFGPFREDATCKILPEGFISENFVDCDPGSPDREPLASRGDAVPVVPLSRTGVSVTLQQVLDTFSLPVDERIRVILSELGVSSAGRGKDLNALLRRVNPALTESRRALALIGSQRARIRNATRQTDRVLATLARRDDDVRRFVASAANVAETTSERREGLGRSVAVLPRLLGEVRASTGAIRTASSELAPTARSLRRSAPGLAQVNTVVPQLSAAARPAFRALGPAANRTGTALKAARPVVRQLRATANDTREPGRSASELLISTRDTGGIEYLMDYIYSLATVSSAYDGISHAISLGINVNSRCIASPSAPGCRGTFNSPGRGNIPVNSPNTPSSAVSNRSGTRPRTTGEDAGGGMPGPSPRTLAQLRKLLGEVTP